MSYRDDREALLHQLETLRGEVEALRLESTSDDDKTKAATLRLNALSEEVTTALQRIDEDRELLKKLAGSLDGLKKTLKPAAAAAAVANVAAATPPTGISESAAIPATAPAPLGAPYPTSRLYLIGALALLSVGALAWCSMRFGSPAPQVDPLRDLPGAPTAVEWEPILARAEREATAGYKPTKIDLWYVKEDGTFDFTAKAYEPYITMEFVGPTPPPPPVNSSVPLGARPMVRSPDPTSTCFTVNRSEGFHKRACDITVNQTAVPRPTCSLKALWAAAKAAGAPAGAVAHLKYEAPFMPKRVLWHFTIENTTTSFTMTDPECQVTVDHAF